MIRIDTREGASIWRSGLVIPAACTAIAQFMQNVYASSDANLGLAHQSLFSPLLLFALLKVVSVVVLAIHCARYLVVRSGSRPEQRHDKRADQYLACLLGANLAIAVALFGCIKLMNSEASLTLREFGVSKTGAKIGLVLIILFALKPLNKRVFHDISIIIGGGNVRAGGGHSSTTCNSDFLKFSTKNFAKYVLPVYGVHVIFAVWLGKLDFFLSVQAASDALVVVVLSLAAGYAIFRSHKEVLSTGA